jgi:hypothetical protein
VHHLRDSQQHSDEHHLGGGGMSKPTDEWYTPVEVLDAVEAFFGQMIGLDPTSTPNSPAWARSAFKMTALDDALSGRWSDAGPVFLNPPYSDPAPFLDAAWEYMLGRAHPQIGPDGREYLGRRLWKPLGVTLTNAATSTRWCQTLLSRGHFACFCSPRIRFLRERTEKDDKLETVYTGPTGVELVQPGSPRYESLIVGFGGQFDRFKAAFGGLGYCTELS